MNVMAFSALFYTAGADSGAPLFRLFRWLQLAFAVPALGLLGWPILKSALAGPVRRGMDLLILVGVAAAFAQSAHAIAAGRGHVYFETAVLVLVLVTLGRYLEAEARAVAAREIGSLLAGVPARALVERGEDGAAEEVAVDEIRPGDRVIVRPGEAAAVDGEVVSGEAAVDASMLTGEARPQPVGPGARVLAGTIPRDGRVVVLARATGPDRLVARLARLLDEARRRRAPVERAADRWAGWFLALAVAAALAALVMRASAGEPAEGVRRALAVLLVACPCSLGLATPLALTVAIARAAREGAIVRSGAAIEALAGVRAAFFDKTGTLTTGRPHLAEVVAVPGIEAEWALATAAALEAASEHAVGRALVAAAEARGGAASRPAVERFRVRPGLGVEGEVEVRPRPGSGPAAAPANGLHPAEVRRALVGSRRLLERDGAAIEPALAARAAEIEAAGRSTVFLALDGRAVAVFGIAEEVREEAAAAIAALRAAGLEVAALTGDGPAAAGALERRLGIPVRHSLLPDEKIAAVEASARGGRPAIMVGDGLNDAPALAAAAVGIAVEGGLDLAREAAAIALVRADLGAVARLVAIARAAARTIRWNLFWSFLYNGAGMGLAAAGFLHPALAAVAMVLSSFFVVGQSLRLRAS
jgi:heavy metal translocating P-type ATPase